MKKLIYIIIGVIAAGFFAGCNDDANKTTWEKYTDWRNTNKTWYAEQEALTNPDGSAYYVRVTPSWNPSATILMHWFNDRSETEGNLTPMLTSTVETYYKGRLYNDEIFDSTASGASYTSQVSTGIDGWKIALMNMRVGDSCRVVMPYQQGYGASANGDIPPYSMLQFDLRLVDITAYEIRPVK
ncbi:MAG: FKBP-type peptidyl-prolyl cis-trans isomerase [Muribaculaceae bacterium]|nr:FKBP-type peptidyl-prolyl cis-trans isomerase [Muribaculaceae bacterium]